MLRWNNKRRKKFDSWKASFLLIITFDRVSLRKFDILGPFFGKKKNNQLNKSVLIQLVPPQGGSAKVEAEVVKQESWNPDQP